MSIAQQLKNMELGEVKSDFSCSYSSLHANRATIRRDQKQMGLPIMNWQISTGKGITTVKRTA